MNKTCRENIPPTFKITTITIKKLVYVEFSEPVQVLNETAISPENLNVEIIGSKGTYNFEWRLISNPNNLLVPERIINKF